MSRVRQKIKMTTRKHLWFLVVVFVFWCVGRMPHSEKKRSGFELNTRRSKWTQRTLVYLTGCFCIFLAI